MGFYQGKKILVAGGTGLIGKPLVKKLLDQGANVRVASLEREGIPNTEHVCLDLTDYTNCKRVCKDREYVFSLIGLKGSPKDVAERPADYFTPVVMFNTNLMEAARRKDVQRYLYTSTIGVYNHDAEISREDDVWKTMPSKKDWFGGWAKRVGELQAEVYEKQYGFNVAVVRPANTYGPCLGFKKDGMVVPSLIRRAVKEDPLIVWGNGSPIRDFIFCEDVAEGMLRALEHPGIYNLGSGRGYSIKELVDIITSFIPRKVKWDTEKPSGDNKRILDISRANRELGWEPRISLREGIEKTIKWYKETELEE